MNRGYITNQISGITGVNATGGGNVNVNLDTNKRYKRVVFRFNNGSGALAVTSAISAITLKPNGVSVRDVAPAEILNILNATNPEIAIPTGELPLFFSEPKQKWLRHNDACSWDMWGQNSFQITMLQQSSLTGATIDGFYDFDYNRNVKTVKQGGKNVSMPFLNPVSLHTYTWSGTGGWNTIAGVIPINYPIRRIWIRGATTGYVTALQVLQDTQLVLDLGTAQHIYSYVQDYGFTLSSTGNGAGTVFYDAAAIFDNDYRFWKGLVVDSSFQLKVYLSTATSLQIVVEALPGGYQA